MNQRLKDILAITATSVLVFCGLFLNEMYGPGSADMHHQIRTASEAPPTVRDSHLLELSKELGIKDTPTLGMSYVDSYDKEGREGEFVQTTNGVITTNAITIRKGLELEDTKRALAHEYLHYVWYTTPLGKDKKLESNLLTLLANDAQMASRVGDYSENGRLNTSELFSFYCTESSDAYLDEYVVAMCNTYIDRSKLTMLR